MMKKKGIERWIRRNMRLIAAILVAVGIAGSAFGAGYFKGADDATQFYNETISSLKTSCIMLPGMNAGTKTTLTYKHGDEGVYRPEDWTMQK